MFLETVEKRAIIDKIIRIIKCGLECLNNWKMSNGILNVIYRREFKGFPYCCRVYCCWGKIEFFLVELNKASDKTVEIWFLQY